MQKLQMQLYEKWTQISRIGKTKDDKILLGKDRLHKNIKVNEY